LDARNNLAVTLRHLGDLEGAERIHRQIASAWAAKEEPRPQDEADALQNLAVVLEESGKLDEAEEALLRVRDLYDRVLAADHFRRAFPRLTLASIRLDRGEFTGAEEVAREAVNILAASLPDSSYVTMTGRCRLGRALAGQGRFGEARSLMEPAVEALARMAQPSIRYELECRRGLRDLYRALGADDRAAGQDRALRSLQQENGRSS
jgi:tetratricopeptide (TPR) repeat protein